MAVRNPVGSFNLHLLCAVTDHHVYVYSQLRFNIYTFSTAGF